MQISFKQYCSFLSSDLFRYIGNHKANEMSSFLGLYFTTVGYRYLFWMRSCRYFRQYIWLLPLFIYSIIRLRLIRYLTGIQIPHTTNIGKGFYIGHFGTIIINGNAIIGDNVNISPGVVVGMANRGPRKGFPVIGNRVYIGPGVKIIGAVKIGNDVCIGANAVVTCDVPDMACVGGIPAKIISMSGTDGYVENVVE